VKSDKPANLVVIAILAVLVLTKLENPGQAARAADTVYGTNKENQSHTASSAGAGAGNQSSSKQKNELAKLNEALAADPSKPLTLRERGRLFWSMHRYDLGLRDFENAYQQDKSTSALQHKAEMERGIRRYDLAIKDYTRLLSLAPLRPEFLRDRGACYLLNGEPGKGKKDFRLFVTTVPEAFKESGLTVVAYTMDGDLVTAMRMLDRYLYLKRTAQFRLQNSPSMEDRRDKAHPNTAPPEVRLDWGECSILHEVIDHKLNASANTKLESHAVLSFFAHGYEQSEKWLRRVRATGPSQAMVLSLRAMCQRAVNNYDAAIKMTKQAIATLPDDRIPYDTLDCIYYQMEKREAGLDELLQLQKEQLKSIGLLLTMADVYAEILQRDKAIACLSEVLKLKPGLPEALLRRAELLRSSGKNKESLADYEAVIRQNPRAGRAYEGAALCYFEDKKYEEAMQQFSKALSNNYNLKMVYNARAQCFDRLGRRKEAEQDRAIARIVDF
jgi:tetratricopeptide (TPR) repeat protein